MEFILDNALLIGLAVISGVMLFLSVYGGGSAAGVANLSATEAVMLMNRAKPLVLDVRDVAEFASGHIQGAKHIALAELANRLKEIEKYKEKPVLVHCQRGVRSKTACNLLRAQGFTQLNQLQGGLDAWLEAKLPLIKD